MTSYNREKYIAEAIESVLSSTYSNIELIVVDDCSKDRTVEIARSFALKDPRVIVHVNEKNLGDYPNRNQAAKYAKGKYIVYLDSDDIMYEHALEFMVRYMEMFPESGFGLSSFYDPKRKYPVCIPPREIYEEHFFGKFGHFDRSPASGIVKLEAFNAVGGFSEKRLIGDNEFWMKIAQKYWMVKFSTDNFWYRSDNDDKEYNSVKADSYAKAKKQVIIEALESKDCPLSEEQRKQIIQELRRSRFQRLVRRAFNKFRSAIKR